MLNTVNCSSCRNSATQENRPLPGDAEFLIIEPHLIERPCSSLLIVLPRFHQENTVMDSFSLAPESYLCIQFCHKSEHIRPDDAGNYWAFQSNLKILILSSDCSLAKKGKLALFGKMTKGMVWILWTLVALKIFAELKFKFMCILNPAQLPISWTASSVLLNSLELQILDLLFRVWGYVMC